MKKPTLRNSAEQLLLQGPDEYVEASEILVSLITDEELSHLLFYHEDTSEMFRELRSIIQSWTITRTQNKASAHPPDPLHTPDRVAPQPPDPVDPDITLILTPRECDTVYAILDTCQNNEQLPILQGQAVLSVLKKIDHEVS